MKSGRPIKPGPLRVLEGNPGKRPLPRPHPLDASEGLPRCPQWLTTEQRRIWRDTVREIRVVLRPADREILAAWCVQVSLLRKCAEAVNAGGVLLRGRNASGPALVRNPASSLLNQHTRLVAQLGAELALTPASRASLTGIGVLPPDNDRRRRAERLLSGGS